ncbi:alanine--glyoxylate aminotransferase family protein [candidate division KSB1 bacterium]|nr:alanine--glyoxylate aminotransferase family protein [candidate division KSB1 bacterium]
MIKNYLLTPGPTQVPPEVLREISRPLIHHRTPQYAALLANVKEEIKYVFQTRNPVLIFASTGTGAMEGAVSNTLSRGNKVIVVIGGKFGERWAQICKVYGIDVIPINVEFGDVVDPSEIASALKKTPNVKAVFCTLTETSTGVVTDIEAIGKIVKDTKTLLIVDSISGLGGQEIKTDDWRVDVNVAGSQKGLMLPPGLAFVSISDKAWKVIDQSTSPKYYFDFKKAKHSLDKNQDAYTGSVSLIFGLKESLRLIRSDGLDRVFARHRAMAEATRCGVRALGLELFSKRPSDIVTAVKVPANVDGQELMKKMRDEYGVGIAGGQEPFKGKIFRISHLGWVERFDVITALSCLELALDEMGFTIEFGKAVGAAEGVFKAQRSAFK